MKFNSLLVLPFVASMFLAVSCSSNDTGYNKEDFEMFQKAIQLEENDTYTGFRLFVNITSISSSENVYSLQKSVSIDRENNFMKVDETITTLSNEEGAQNGKKTTSTTTYYDEGSAYILQSDGDYVQKDGTVTQNVTPSIHPEEDCFQEVQLTKNGNVYAFEAKIVSEKANELFGANNLSEMKNGVMTADFYDNIMEEVSWNYEIKDMKVSQRLVISYSQTTIVLPTITD